MKEEIDWDNPFKSEDFEDHAKVIAMRNSGLYGLLNWRQMSEVANARLREILKEHGKKVWRADVGNYNNVWIDDSEYDPPGTFTNTAILICEKEILK